MRLMREIIREKLAVFDTVLKTIPELRYVGDPVLRTPTTTVTLEEGRKIGNTLGKILLKYRFLTGVGRGLAAPQIGLSKSVFVTFVEEKLQTFINPVITERSKETNIYKELCLSSGIMAAEVERPEWIRMEWVDEEGKKHHEKADGMLARLRQHEERHLRGVVNLDEATRGGIEFATFDPLKEVLRKK